MTGSTGGPGDEFVASFLDDYFAEAEEHLATIRRALLAIERGLGDAPADPALLEELFRSFHSLKGISAMVDLRDAERLAHELESWLRGFREGQLPLTAGTLATVIDGTAVLESVIAARRAGAAPPPLDAVLARLAAPALRATVSGGAAVSAPAGPGSWRVTFVPSAALVDRGVKVDTIRTRLAGAGRIVSVTPKVTPGGGIAFEFIVSGVASASAFEPWQDDGLAWERLEAGDAAAVPAPDEVRTSSAAGGADRAILAPSQVVRVDLKRLDDVVRRVADLVVTRARLSDSLARVERLIPSPEWRNLQEIAFAVDRQLRDLRDDVMRVRLVRVDEIFRRMPFVARDVAREAGSDVRVEISGQDTEIDKFLVERMMDPVLHLVRNAVSHGIEPPDGRRAAGKAAQGTLTLRASTSGELVVIEVADDGRGIDAAAVVERARAAGVARSDAGVDESTLLELICEPGLSTRGEADRASGRGIGMAVVRTAVRELGGTMRLETRVGEGTRFVLTLPLTLAITEALIAAAAGSRFAVPQSTVHEVIEIDERGVRQLESGELIPYRDRSLPLVRLRTLFGFGASTSPKLHAFVVGSGHEAVALGVDRILGQREIVVRTIGDALLRVDGISGATEMGDGRVVLILDVPALVRRARTLRPPRRTAPPSPGDDGDAARGGVHP
jgi:two-component system chemotaxis sensor kinase CheA